jgi:hypothetical protein
MPPSSRSWSPSSSARPGKLRSEKPQKPSGSGRGTRRNQQEQSEHGFGDNQRSHQIGSPVPCGGIDVACLNRRIKDSDNGKLIDKPWSDGGNTKLPKR